jgi:hypothetical protein
MAKERPASASLFGKGESFEVGEHTYKVLPMSLEEVLGAKGVDGEFTADNLSLDKQGWNILIPDARAKVDKWLQRKVVDEKGSPMSMDRAVEDGWDFDDVRSFLRMLAGLSG